MCIADMLHVHGQIKPCVAMWADGGNAPDLAEMGEELEADHVDDVLQRCEAISANLRSALGGAQVTDR